MSPSRIVGAIVLAAFAWGAAAAVADGPAVLRLPVGPIPEESLESVRKDLAKRFAGIAYHACTVHPETGSLRKDRTCGRSRGSEEPPCERKLEHVKRLLLADPILRKRAGRLVLELKLDCVLRLSVLERVLDGSAIRLDRSIWRFYGAVRLHLRSDAGLAGIRAELVRASASPARPEHVGGNTPTLILDATGIDARNRPEGHPLLRYGEIVRLLERHGNGLTDLSWGLRGDEPGSDFRGVRTHPIWTCRNHFGALTGRRGE